MEESISTKKLASELIERVIPALEREKEKLQATRHSLGLRADPSDPYRTKWSYPAAISPEEAYLKARDTIGGEFFVIARKEVRRLESAEKKTSLELKAFMR